jgi:hypothetical protein
VAFVPTLAREAFDVLLSDRDCAGLRWSRPSSTTRSPVRGVGVAEGMTPCHCFALLASITMRAIVMDSEMMDRTRGLRF